MHPFPASLLLLLTFLGQSLSGQDVGYYLNEMNTDPGMDASFNAEIDTIWARSMRDAIDSTNYGEPVSLLQGYYDTHQNVITGDKAELYGYFLLFKHRDYAAIIDRFEAKIGAYDHRAFTTIGELHRRSLNKLNKSTYTAYLLRMDSLAGTTTSEDFAAFHARVSDLQEGQPAPAFTVTDLEGREYDLDSLAGKVVVLDFWATWCPPCVKEIPNIKVLNDALADREDFVLISVSLDDDTERLTRFIERNGLSWPQAMDHGGKTKTDGVLATAYQAQGLPKYLLIGKDGILRYNSHLHDHHFVPLEIVKRYL